MANPNISATLTPANQTTIQTGIAAILVLLPFLVNLTPAERKKLRKMATKRTGYVSAVYNASLNNPNAIPTTFSMPEFTKDFNLDIALKAIRAMLLPLTEGIDDTLLAIGHEQMQESDMCYGFLQQGAKGDAALTAIVQNISTAFAGQGKKKPGVTISVPAGGSVTIKKVNTAKHLINSGITILGYYKVGDLASSMVLLNPSDSVKLPKDFANLVIVNQSATLAGQFTYTQKP